MLDKNGFNLQIRSTLNTKGIEDSLKKLQAKIKTVKVSVATDGKVDKVTKKIYEVVDALGNLHKIVDNGKTKVDTLTKKIQNIATETHKYTKKNGDLVTQIKEVNSEGQTFITRITQSENELGEITKITQKYDAQNHKLGEAIKEVYQDETKLTKAQKERAEALKQEVNTAREFTTFEKGVVTAVKEEAQVVTDANGKIKSLTKTTKTWEDLNGYLHESIVTIDQDGKQVGRTIENIKKAEQDTAKQTQEFGQQAQTLGERFANMVKNFATFYVATLPTQLFRQAISESVQLVKDFDNALIELKYKLVFIVI